MDQEKGAGHHVITQEAVHELFTSGRADENGLIEGLTKGNVQSVQNDAASLAQQASTLVGLTSSYGN